MTSEGDIDIDLDTWIELDGTSDDNSIISVQSLPSSIHSSPGSPSKPAGENELNPLLFREALQKLEGKEESWKVEEHFSGVPDSQDLKHSNQTTFVEEMKVPKLENILEQVSELKEHKEALPILKNTLPAGEELSVSKKLLQEKEVISRTVIHSWNPAAPENPLLFEDTHRSLKELHRIVHSKPSKTRKIPETPVFSSSFSISGDPNLEDEEDFIELHFNRKKVSITAIFSAVLLTHAIAFGVGIYIGKGSSYIEPTFR